MKLKQYIDKYYDTFKTEYCASEIDLDSTEKMQKDREQYLKDQFMYAPDYWRYSHYSDDRVWEQNNARIKKLKNDIVVLKEKMTKLTTIKNNNEQLISLSRKDLNSFSFDKIILEVGTSGLGESNAELQGSLKGGMSGSSFLGFGSIGGSIKGSINGSSSSKYEDYILIRYKYDLDYVIDEIIFDIELYLK